ncbi:Integral membrane protein CcmA involved in cell shape determination [Halovivax ruber XH-70]|uniref:Integral membrane protein CcmA involved in cell shape determination n=1 Tax=Halovivax ruber (strain DSM 18193 / JCM 13892 / XH-70) TaxID=797302 RepID=L0I5R5_HALRX|nr:polymer-forming cytoskeletal protein [Halovivax ruber]AGB14855.1 Integral membrane protein CcmA involved in cell shape determination [Halovivax ruber XH-70]
MGAKSSGSRQQTNRHRLRQIGAVVLVTLLLVGSMPLAVTAQTDGDAGGSVVVEEGETVDTVNAFAGHVVVRGTVEGDVMALAGNVRIAESGSVEGDVSAFAGNVEIAGTVEGDVMAAGGNLQIAESASIAGDLEAGAGTAMIDGEIDGDAEISADTITLGETASIGGDLAYSGDLQGNQDAVSGTITEDANLGPDVGPNLGPLASWFVALYGLILNLILGAILLALFPYFSRRVAGRGGSSPLRAGLIGLGVLIVVPILLVAIAITVVGIPITILGFLVFAIVCWISLVYGWFTIGAWVLSAGGVESAWLALVVGLVGGALLSQLPFVGALLTFLVLLLGLGALSMGIYGNRRRERDSEARQTTWAGGE